MIEKSQKCLILFNNQLINNQFDQCYHRSARIGISGIIWASKMTYIAPLVAVPMDHILTLSINITSFPNNPIPMI